MEIFATQLHEACRIFAAEKMITSCHTITIIATATALGTTMTIAVVPVQAAITKNMSMVRSVGK